ncbi:MAG: hypothetical protein ABW201_08080 [Candidatus Thiodiazotropha sp.]
MKAVKITIVTLLLLFYVSQSVANETIIMSVEEYVLLKKESPEKADNYLSGVLSSYVLANAMLEKRGQNELFCMPNNVSINKENINGIINLATSITTEINKTERLKASVASFILWSLVEAYPCK